MKQLSSFKAGQALVEFALVITLLMLLMLGVVDGARAYSTVLAMESAASEGASYASMKPDDSATAISRAKAEGAGSLGVDPGRITANITPPPVVTGGAMITCTVTYDFNPFFDVVSDHNLNITRTATAPIME